MREVVVCALAALCLGGVAAAGPLDKPAFTATPDELLAAARAVPRTDAEVVVLRHDTSVTLDALGRSTQTYRMVFVVEKPTAVDGWGTIGLEWSPFYQDKPIFRARVITDRDHVAELDPSLVSDAPTVDDSPSVFSDRRQIKAPLPRLAVGAVVEQVITIHDRAPLLSAGTVDHFGIGSYAPVQRRTLTIDAPSQLPVRIVPRGFTKPPVISRAARRGRTTWRYDGGPFPALAPRPPRVPSAIATWPAIGVSTAASWAAVAANYRQIVDDRILHSRVELPAEAKGATPRETVDRTLAWLQHHVRYTGIELSDAEIAPWPPAATMKRGFGDCKDKATLLVALLRAAGIHADVALLSTGPGLDVDPALPGMGEFDHAIVRAQVDGKALWIDATEDGLPAGQLPARDQGRRALVIERKTRGLVTTPVSAPADNLVREVRTYHVAEHDRASVTEVTTEHGVFWDNLRSWARATSHDELTKNLTSYANSEYEGKLVRFSGANADDVTRPFAFTVEVDDSPRVFTERRQIQVYLHRSDTFVHVPDLLKKRGDDLDREAAARRYDYVWYQPHVYEIENRLVLPTGYTIPHLTAHEQLPLGTMTLTTDRRVEGNQLIVTYRLDTGKRRLTPAEVKATRAAVRRFYEGPADHLVIAQTGAELVREGKLKQAVAEYQRLIGLHPREALHYGQLADAYRVTGMGTAARAAVRKGVAVEPCSDAYDMLAWQLRHDTLGREWGAGADRAGAIAAYRKALALDPHHLGALADFAELLAHDAHGRPTTVARDRQEAISLWKRAKDVGGSDTYDELIGIELLRAGQFADAEAFARTMPESQTRAKLLVTAVAASRGVPEALAIASSLVKPDEQDEMLGKVAGELTSLRRYDDARTMFAEAHSLSASTMYADMMRKLKRLDLTRLDRRDPKTPALLAISVATGGDAGRDPPWKADVAHALRVGIGQFRQRDWRRYRMFDSIPRPVAEDMVAALVNMTSDGDARHGWRVEATLGPMKVQFYVALVRGRAVILGSPDAPAGLGRRVLALVAHHDLAGATRWIRWVAEDIARATVPTGYERVGTLYKAATAGGRTLSARDLELAAGFLLRFQAPALAAPILHRATSLPGIDRPRREAELEALVRLHRWNDVIAGARALVAQDPSATDAVFDEALALGEQGKLADAAAVVDHGLAAVPDAHRLLAVRATIAIQMEPWTSARPWVDKASASPDLSELDLNNLAWEVLYHGTPDEARVFGQRAERMSAILAPALANTLAAIEAEANRPYQAWGYLQKSIEGHPDGQPGDSDWYVLGRIAEAYGLRDDAIADYRRVHKPKYRDLQTAAYDFARRGLARLGAH